MSRASDFLKVLVNSPSPTHRQDEVRKTQTLVAQALTDLGFQIRWVQDASGATEDLLIAEKNGRNDSFITFVSHIDTVLAPEDSGPFRIENSADGVRAKGAGIIDNKGGLAVLIESLRLFLKNETDLNFGLRVVSSPDEENGSSAWHETYRNLGMSSVAVLGFEPALDNGSIIESRRGNRWYDIEIHGIEAHAGRCRGEEINAAHEAARLVTRLLHLRDELQKLFPVPTGLGLSLNVGHIEGGRDRHNVICGHIKIKLDTRFSNFSERDRLHEEILKVLASPMERSVDGKVSRIEFKIVDDCPPFSLDASSSLMIKSLVEKISTIENRKIGSLKAGGAGDVNHMSRPGLFILDGLGPVGGRMHTVEEFLTLSTLESRAKALAEWYPMLIDELSKTQTVGATLGSKLGSARK